MILKPLLKVLDRLEETMIATLMGAATLVIFVAVIHRYASGVSWLQPCTDLVDLYWAQELCIYMFVWMAKFGAAYGVRTGIHVGVDVMIGGSMPRWHGRLYVFGLLAGALFTGIVGTLGANFVWRIATPIRFPPTGSAEVAGLSGGALGSYLMCFRFLQVCVRFVADGRTAGPRPRACRGLDERGHEGPASP